MKVQVKILESSNVNELAKQIEEHINNDFKRVGSLVVSSASEHDHRMYNTSRGSVNRVKTIYCQQVEKWS